MLAGFSKRAFTGIYKAVFEGFFDCFCGTFLRFYNGFQVVFAHVWWRFQGFDPRFSVVLRWSNFYVLPRLSLFIVFNLMFGILLKARVTSSFTHAPLSPFRNSLNE